MGTEAKPKTEPKKRLLVVDDHEDNVEVLRARLEARGYEVQGANDGQAALDMLEKWIPDLILLDVMMPKVDGLEVVRRVKANDKLPFIPVIMQTALDSTERMVAGFEAGADDYVTKPINFAELEARVKSLLRIKALQEALAERERELSEMNDKLLHISLTDGLTGIDNRRSLEQRLHDLVGGHLWTQFRSRVPDARWNRSVDQLAAHKITPHEAARQLSRSAHARAG